MSDKQGEGFLFWSAKVSENRDYGQGADLIISMEWSGPGDKIMYK